MKIFNRRDQRLALQLARAALEQAFHRPVKWPKLTPAFDQTNGVFVTLKENGQLRGCIGQIIGREPLRESIPAMARAAAFEDPRFPPLRAEELDQIEIEISLLSQPRLVKDWREIKLGRDGVIVRGYGRSGVFLPQVAAETGWNREEFLHHLCQEKAGLPGNCYQDPAVQLYAFQAQVFGERN